MKSGMLAAEALYQELLSVPPFSEEEAGAGAAPIEVTPVALCDYCHSLLLLRLSSLPVANVTALATVIHHGYL